MARSSSRASRRRNTPSAKKKRTNTCRNSSKYVAAKSSFRRLLRSFLSIWAPDGWPSNRQWNWQSPEPYFRQIAAPDPSGMIRNNAPGR
jgi:hypothetical protein